MERTNELGQEPLATHAFPPVWPDGYVICSIFGHLQQWTFAHNLHTKFAEVGSKFCPMLNKFSNKSQSLVKCFQSGEISPHMVTLPVTHVLKLLLL